MRCKHISFVHNKDGVHMQIHLPSTKNNQKGEGRTILIPPYEGKEKYCLIQITRKYLDIIKKDPETPLQQGIVVIDKATKVAKPSCLART